MLSSEGPELKFHSLPTEVLWKVLSDASLESTDLYHLSRVNKKLSQVVQQVLYSNIDLTSDQPTAVEKLLTSLNANVYLLPLIRHLKLRSIHGREWVAIPESINQAFKQILGLHLPALESLAWEMAKINISVYEVNPMLPVRSIYVNHVSIKQATTLMLLPNIECIHIKYIDDVAQHSVSSSLVGKGSKFSTAKDIRIDNGFRPRDSLSSIVDWPRELQSFHGSTTIDGNLSPTSFDCYLEPVKDTLVDLSVVARTRDYTLTDGTFIYFETFKCLKYLNATASLLFGNSWESPTAERAGLFRRLPATLKTLSVFFENRTVAITTGREDIYSGTETPSDYLWIIELANLPNFEYLRIEEGLSRTDFNPDFKSFKWVPHHIIFDCFESNAIKLEASLRSYKQNAVAVDERRTRIATQREARALARIATAHGL